MPTHRVGQHVSIAGGLARAITRAAALGCDALQVFPSNPRGWATTEPDRRAETAFRDTCAARGWPVFVHAPYLVNLASPADAVFARSCECLAFALARSVRLGARSVVVHAGSAVGTDRHAARRRAVVALLRLLDTTPGADVAIELTAGGRERALARHVGDGRKLIDCSGGDERVGICLDTCHLWAAGVDWTSPRGLRQLRADVRELGRERVRVVHVNDSRDAFGSARDHHANVGDGEIGLEPFRRFLGAPEWSHAPFVCETPGSDAQRAADVARVRRLVRARRSRT